MFNIDDVADGSRSCCSICCAYSLRYIHALAVPNSICATSFRFLIERLVAVFALKSFIAPRCALGAVVIQRAIRRGGIGFDDNSLRFNWAGGIKAIALACSSGLGAFSQQK